MASLPNHQESRVNRNVLAGKLNTRELSNNKIYGFWEEILDKSVDNGVGTTLSSSENAVELNGSTGHSIRPLTEVSDRNTSQAVPNVQVEVLASATSTNNTQQLDLFQVGVELLQERLTWS